MLNRFVTRLAALAFGGLMIGAGGVAQADVRYNNPQLNGAIVDWCASWATNCGNGGANLFCQQRGHPGARNWTTYYPGRTWVIGSSTYCNGANCQGFSQVTCIAAGTPGGPTPGSGPPPGGGQYPVPGGVRINYPQANGAIVDWCATWASNCGAGGANLVCQQRGYSQAISWNVYRPGRTWVIGSSTYCNGGNCQGFSQVTCATGASQPQQPPQPPYQPPAAGMRFNYPQQNGAIVDWCATWASNCGAGGATQFCQQRGYSQAVSWNVYRPGRTWVIGSGTYCNGPNCQGFLQVTCR